MSTVQVTSDREILVIGKDYPDQKTHVCDDTYIMIYIIRTLGRRCTCVIIRITDDARM
jgi:hypothetical protein